MGETVHQLDEGALRALVRRERHLQYRQHIGQLLHGARPKDRGGDARLVLQARDTALECRLEASAEGQLDASRPFPGLKTSVVETSLRSLQEACAAIAQLVRASDCGCEGP